MRIKKAVLPICLIFLITALALPLLAQGTKVKVVVENASLRLKPSLDSEAIEESIPLNTVLTSENKVGEWYEVKYQSQVGVALIGYIHEMYVEVLVEEVPPPPVQEAERPPLREVRRPGPLLPAEYGQKKMEIFFGGGLGFGSPLNSSTDYNYHWGVTGPLDYMDAAGQVSHSAGGPKGLGLSLAYFFGGGFGLSLRVDVNFSQKLTGDSAYNLTWKWWDRGPFTETNGWDFAGSLSVIPISLNAVYKFDLGMVNPYISAGPAFFLGKLKIDTTIGLGDTWTYLEGGILWRAIDYFAIPAYVDQSLNGIGFNIGAGLDVALSPSFGLTLDLAYFIKGNSEVAWSFRPGSYDANIDPNWYWDLTKETLDNILDYIPPLTVKLSFFKISVGLKIYL
ncbi:MAG TPA: outer membrane beta-barrel protein [Acidobacteriota bacterium]